MELTSHPALMNPQPLAFRALVPAPDLLEISACGVANAWERARLRSRCARSVGRAASPPIATSRGHLLVVAPSCSAYNGRMPPAGTLPRGFNPQKFLSTLDQNAELRGMRVVFYDGAKLRVLREGPPLCEAGQRSIVIKPDIGEITLHSEQAAQSRESHLYLELVSGAFGCTGAVVGWMVVLGRAGAAPVTGGASAFVVRLAWVGAVSGSVQCANSAVRIYGELFDEDLLNVLDSDFWYTNIMRALDAISLVGAGAGAYGTLRMVLALRASTGRGMLEVLKGLSRQQRKRLAEEVVRLENPGISNGALKALVRAGEFPKRFTQLGVNQAIRNQLKDALNAALGLASSATGGLVREAGGYIASSSEPEGRSLSVSRPDAVGYVVGVAQTFETY